MVKNFTIAEETKQVHKPLAAFSNIKEDINERMLEVRNLSQKSFYHKNGSNNSIEFDPVAIDSNPNYL